MIISNRLLHHLGHIILVEIFSNMLLYVGKEHIYDSNYEF